MNLNCQILYITLMKAMKEMDETISSPVNLPLEAIRIGKFQVRFVLTNTYESKICTN